MDLSLQLQHELVAVQTETDLHVLVELTAPVAPTDHAREPLRIALVVDRSGSMSGAKLEAAKRSIAYLAEQLTADDRLAVIAYDDQVTLPFPLGPVDVGAIGQALAGIVSGGSTNLSGGWLKGVEQLRQVDDGVRRVVLLSDGHANTGITEPAVLARMAGEVAGSGISTTTIGFGDGFDEHLMTAIADSGGGSGHFAQSPDDAAGIFAEEFDDLATLVAQNLSVEVRPSADVEVIEVLNAYPSTVVAGGVQVLLGDAFAGHTARVVLRLRVPAIAQLGLASIGEVIVRWVALDGQIAEHTVTQPLVVNAVSADDASEGLPNAAVVEEIVVLTAGRATEQARDLAEQGDLDGAKRLLDANLARLREVSSDHPAAGQLRETIARLEFTGQAMASETYGPAEAKRMHYESRNLRRNKRNTSTPRSGRGSGDDQWSR
jgi:Ca-activated chloride channel homolog